MKGNVQVKGVNVSAIDTVLDEVEAQCPNGDSPSRYKAYLSNFILMNLMNSHYGLKH